MVPLRPVRYVGRLQRKVGYGIPLPKRSERTREPRKNKIDQRFRRINNRGRGIDPLSWTR